MEFPLSYERSFQIRTSEIDPRKQATVSTLVKLMHEAAMQHAIELKLSVWDLAPLEISWVLIRKYLEIERLPLLGERVRVQTCPSGFHRSFTFRDYRIIDQAGKLIAYSGSTWLLMNMTQRKMAPIPDFILEYGKQLAPQDQYLPRPEIRMPLLEQAHTSKDFRVDWHDLDFNHHLNNTLYVQWMLEALGRERLESGRLKRLEVFYRSECHFDDVIVSEVMENGAGTFLHRLRLKESGKELVSGRTFWED